MFAAHTINFLQIHYGFHCCVKNGYDRVDLCRLWNESQRPVLPRCLTVSADAASDKYVAGDTSVFQQDSAPSHHANDTIKLLQQEMTDFIGHQIAQTWNQWIISSGVLCSSRMNVVWTMSMSWSSTSLKSGTVCSWRTLLMWPSTSGESDRVCMHADGQHFEHLLWVRVTDKSYGNKTLVTPLLLSLWFSGYWSFPR